MNIETEKVLDGAGLQQAIGRPTGERPTMILFRQIGPVNARRHVATLVVEYL